MATVASMSELQFEPPGPGSWGLDAVHFPRPVPDGVRVRVDGDAGEVTVLS